MKIERVSSMDLPQGVPVAQYEETKTGLSEMLANLAASKLPPGATAEGILVGVANKYARQKDALVDARDFLWSEIKARTGWKGYKTEEVEQAGKKVTVEAEPEQKNINRFVAQLMDGSFSHKDFTLTGTPEQREPAIWAVLQKWIDEGAKTTDVVNDKGEVTGTAPLTNGRLSRWTVDLSVPERKSKPKTPPDYAVKNAESVFSDTDKTGAPKKTKLADRLEKWYQEFTKKGVTFSDFRDTKDAAQAKLSLAWAIKANEDFEREQREKANPYK